MKRLMNLLLIACLWDRLRPLAPQHRSREAWIAHCAQRGLNGDRTPKAAK